MHGSLYNVGLGSGLKIKTSEQRAFRALINSLVNSLRLCDFAFKTHLRLIVDNGKASTLDLKLITHLRLIVDNVRASTLDLKLITH